MSQIPIPDILPWTQAVASGGQTVYSTTWTANVASDVVVYSRAANTAANDVTQILNSSQYSVAFIGGTQIVQVTLVTPSTLGDIVTITRQTPADYLNLYSNTNFAPTMLNNDFSIMTLVDQQAQLVNSFIGPRYNYSEELTAVVDTILPLLGANQTWVKNSGNTAFIPFTLPSSGIAPSGATYLTEAVETTNLPDSFQLLGTANQIKLTAGTNQLFVGIPDNPVMPGSGGMGIPVGTTAQRVIQAGNISLRFNTTDQLLEYYDGDWEQLSFGGTVDESTANNLAYYQNTGNEVTGLASANNGVLVTSNSGVPSISSTLPIAVQTNITELGTITTGIWNGTTIAIAHGGTGVTSVTIAPTASSFAGWDANSNMSANNFIEGYATTVTAAGTTTLTVASAYSQFFTGSTTQTVVMPVTSTLALGQQYYIVNNSSGNVTVKSSGANNIVVMPASSSVWLTCILTSGTTAASWNADFVESGLTLPISLANGGTNASLTASNGGIFYSTATAGAILAGTATAGLALLSGSSTAPTWSTSPPFTKKKITTYTSGTNTFTTDANCVYADVEIVGSGGASGSVAGTAGQGAASAGGGGGGYCRKTYTAAQIGATATVVIGAASTPGSSGNHAGGNGNNSTFTPAGAGATLTAGGGNGGGGSASSATTTSATGGAGGTATGGDLNIVGGYGGDGLTINGAAQIGIAGAGGASFFASNAPASVGPGGYPANLYGGGGGGYQNASTSNQQGLAGAAGYCIVTEYVSV